MAEEPVTLGQVRAHLRLSASQTAQDEHLKLLISAARRSIENKINRVIYATHPDIDPLDLPVIQQAMLMLVGHWFANREAVGATGVGEMPLAVKFLIDPLRRFR